MLNQAGFQSLHGNIHKDEEVISSDLSENIKRVKWISAADISGLANKMLQVKFSDEHLPAESPFNGDKVN